MKKILPTTLIALLVVALSPLWAPATGSTAQPPAGGEAKITIHTDGKCKIDVQQINCAGANCKRGAPVNWTVDNDYAQKATVLLVNFRIDVNGTVWYLDPLRQIGPGANRAEHFVDVDAGGEEVLRTLVRVIEHAEFRGTYDYDIAIRFNDTGDFALCPDPMLDIDG